MVELENILIFEKNMETLKMISTFKKLAKFYKDFHH